MVTATNRMHNNDLEACGKKCCYFYSIARSNLWRVFDVFLDLVILPYFNTVSVDFFAVMCLINIYFVKMSMFVSWKMLI